MQIFFNGIYRLFQKLIDDSQKKTCHNIFHIVQKIQGGGFTMIEEYIEKNILRQLFLCGQFYVNKEVNLEKLSNLLHVCKTTLLNDINNIKKNLKNKLFIRIGKRIVTLYIFQNIYLDVRSCSN